MKHDVGVVSKKDELKRKRREAREAVIGEVPRDDSSYLFGYHDGIYDWQQDFSIQGAYLEGYIDGKADREAIICDDEGFEDAGIPSGW